MSDDEKALKLLQRLQAACENEIYLIPSLCEVWYIKIVRRGYSDQTFGGETLLDVVAKACIVEGEGGLVDDMYWDEVKESFGSTSHCSPGFFLDQLRELGYKISKE